MATSRISTPLGRLIWLSLDTTAVFNGQDTGKYQAAILLPPTADLSRLNALAAEAAASKFGADTAGIVSPFTKAEDHSKLSDEFNGWTVVKTKSKYRPQIVARDGDTAIDASDPDGVYSGVEGRISVSAYGWTFGGKRGVSFNLHHVQKTADAERIGPSSSARDDFEPLEPLPGGDAKGGGLDFLG